MAPPLDRRLERFVQRYIDSPLKVEIIRIVARYPNHAYSLPELAAIAQADPRDIERAVFRLGNLGLVFTKTREDSFLVGLSRSPVVRDMAIRLFRYTSKPGGRAGICRLLKDRPS